MNVISEKRTRASSLALMVIAVVSLAGVCQAANWQIETIDATGVGKFSSLKIDRDGNAHVAYVTDDGGNTLLLKYAFWDHLLKNWFIMPIARGASFSSLVLDSKQRPHISYADAGTITGTKLHHAYWDGTEWKRETVPVNSTKLGYWTSIALDSHDFPTLSYYELDGPAGTDYRVRMRTVTWNGKYWELNTVDGSNQSGKFNSLAMDAQDHTHLAYANVNATTAGIRYAFWDGKKWNLDVVEGLQNTEFHIVGYSCYLVLDQDGNPHITYTDMHKPAVKYAVRKDGRWNTEQVDLLGNAGYPDRNSLALDSQGIPYVGYHDAGRGLLKVAHKEGDKWMAEIVDSNSTGYTSSMQIDHGVLWISYADESSGALRVARKELGNSEQVAAPQETPHTEAQASGAQAGTGQ